MLKFSEYIKEEADSEEVISIDSKFLEGNLDTINDALDEYTKKPYQNAPIFLRQLRGALERFGMNLPQSATVNFLNLGAELVYALGDTKYFLYIVYDTNEDSFVDGYAQIVAEDELADLVNMDKMDMLDHEPIQQRPSTWYAKRDDDSGNTSEY